MLVRDHTTVHMIMVSEETDLSYGCSPHDNGSNGMCLSVSLFLETDMVVHQVHMIMVPSVHMIMVRV